MCRVERRNRRGEMKRRAQITRIRAEGVALRPGRAGGFATVTLLEEVVEPSGRGGGAVDNRHLQR
jgi:hypothetical protein